MAITNSRPTMSPGSAGAITGTSASSGRPSISPGDPSGLPNNTSQSETKGGHHPEDPNAYGAISREHNNAGLGKNKGYHNDEGDTAGGNAFKNAAGSILGGAPGGGFNIQSFLNLANASGGYIPKQTLGIKNDLPFSEEIISEIEGVAGKMVQLGGISRDDAEDFLYILITIDSLEVMEALAETSGIAELADEDILNDPLEILAVPYIEKLAFMADAIAAIIKAYNKYKGLANHDGGSRPSSSDMSSIISNITGAVGNLFGGGGLGGQSGGQAQAQGSSPGTMMGVNLSKMLLGKEVPMSVQTNNPNLLPPSVVAQRVFGQRTNFAQVQDPKQFKPKKIGIFTRPQGGAATGGMNMKHAKSLSGSQSLQSAINNFIGINQSPFAKLLQSRASQSLPNILGGSLGSSISLKHADSGIPFMKGMSDVMGSMTEKQPEMNKEQRELLETITGQTGGIANLFKRGVDISEAQKNNLNKTSPTPSPLPIITKVVSLFPTSMFQQGWQEQAYVHQELSKDDEFYKKVIYILETLG